jgi:glutamate synthase domain-containing protein 3
MKINAEGVYYRDLNQMIHDALEKGETEITLDNVRGQRYIGCGLDGNARITINGVPGQDLAAFMNGAEITINGNGQDGVGNTMNAGKVVIRGDAGDIVGHSMRGGKILVRGNVGYRAGIHMKAYGDRFPAVVIGGIAGDYLGEYMAGGLLVVLNLDGKRASPAGEYIGTGMHGGLIYLRGKVEPYQLGAEVGLGDINDEEWRTLGSLVAEYGRAFDLDTTLLQHKDFLKLYPKTTRPYGTLYAY